MAQKSFEQFFSKLKPFKTKLTHPLVCLFSNYNSEELERLTLDEESEIHRIPNLKIIPQAKIQKATSKLEKQELYESIAPIAPFIEFDTDRFQEEVSILKSSETEDRMHVLLLMLVDVLAFLVTANSKKELLTNENCVIIVNALALNFDMAYLPACSLLFQELTQSYLKIERFKWSSAAVEAWSNYLVLNEDLGKSISPLIIKLVFVAAENRQCNSVPIMEAICKCMVMNRPILRKREMLKLVASANVHVGRLNMSAIKIVSIASKKELSQAVRDCFILLTTASLSHIGELAEVIKPFDESKAVIRDPVEVPNISESNFIFVDDDPTVFENGFTPFEISMEYELRIRESDLYDFISTLAHSFSKAHRECLSLFVEGMRDFVSLWYSSERYFDYCYVVMYFVNRFRDLVDIDTFIPLTSNKRLFTDGFTIFDRNLPEDVSVLRQLAIELYCKTPSVVEFLLSSIHHPVLAAEIIVRIASCKFLAVFISESSFKSVLTVIHSLVSMRKTDKSDAILWALHATLDFTFTLLDPNLVSREEFSHLIGSNTFVNGFLGLVFVDVLRPMILAKVRNLLVGQIYNGIILGPMCSYFCWIIDKCKDSTDSRCDDLVRSISNVLIYSLSHNMSLVVSFKTALQAMLVYVHAKPSVPVMQCVLKFFNLMMQNTVDFHLTTVDIRLLVEMIKKVGSTSSVLVNIMNLCASTSSIGTNTLFLIKQPMAIPIAFAAFGESSELVNLTQHFINLCEFSPSNCIECHKSGIDSILLEFIRNFTCKGSRVVSFRGFEFELCFTRQQIDSLILPLLMLIASVASNNAVAQGFIDLVMEIKHPEICVPITRWMNGQIALMSSGMRPLLPLGLSSPICVISHIDSELINCTFSMAFWLKLDVPISYQKQDSTLLMKIEDSHETELRLFINRDSLYFSYNKTDISFQCVPNIKPNKWMFIGFMSQRFSKEQTAIGIFSDGQIGSCQEITAFEFVDDVKMTVGGEGNDSMVGLLGAFMVSKGVIDDDVFAQMSIQGATCFDDWDDFLIKTEKTDLIISSPDSGITCGPIVSYDNQNALDRVLCANHHILSFLPLFKDLGNAPDGFIEHVIGIMKQVHTKDETVGYSGIIRTYLMNYSESCLSYSLYLALFALFDVFRDECLFDDLIVNIELWSRSPAMCFIRVVHHWEHSAINSCRALFERPGYFVKILKMYEYVFGKGGINKNYSDAEIRKSNSLFVRLIEETGKFSIDANGVFYMIDLMWKYDDDVTITMLNCMLILSEIITDSRDDIIDSLCPLIESTNMDVVMSAIRVIHQFSLGASLQERMTAIAIQLRTNDQLQNIFDAMLSELQYYHGFLHTVCIIVCGFDSSYKKRLAKTIRTVFDEAVVESPITENRLWFVWPLFAATQMPNGMSNDLLLLIAKIMCSYPAEVDASFALFVDVTQIFASIIPFSPCQVVLDVMIALNAISSGRISNMIYDCVRAGLFRYVPFWIDPHLTSLLAESPYDVVNPGIAYDKINNILVLEEVLNRDFDNHMLIYGLSVESDWCLEQEGMMHMWFQLMDSPSLGTSVQYLKTIMDFVRQIVYRNIAPIQPDREMTIHINEVLRSVQHEMNEKHRELIRERIEELKAMIKTAKRRVFVDKDEVLQKCNGYRQSVEHIVHTSGKLRHKDVTHFMRHLTPEVPITAMTPIRCRELNQCFVPAKFLQSPAKEFEDLLSNSKISKDYEIIASHEITLWTFGSSSQMTCDLTPDLIFIHNNREAIAIQHSDILIMLERSETCVEIVTKSSGSFYCDFAPVTASSIIDQVCPGSHSDPQELLESLTSTRISNFQYLMIMNFFNGRSFHKDPHPSLPLPDSDGNLVETPSEQFFFPTAASDVAKVYENRKNLERMDIASYSRDTFKDHYAEQVPLNTDNFVRAGVTLELPVTDFASCDFVNQDLLYILKDKTIYFVDTASSEIVAEKQPSISGCCCPFGNGVVIFSDDGRFEHVSLDSQSPVFDSIGNISFPVSDGATFAFVCDECSVAISSAESIDSPRRILTTTQRICCLAISESQKIVAYGTDACKIFVHSLVTGELTAQIDLGALEPLKLLVTPLWGTIAAVTDELLLVYTVNGILVSKRKIESPIKEWSTFTESHGFDCIIYIDDESRIGAFDVFAPDEVKFLPSRISKTTKLYHNTHKMSVIGVTQDDLLTISRSPLQDSQ